MDILFILLGGMALILATAIPRMHVHVAAPGQTTLKLPRGEISIVASGIALAMFGYYLDSPETFTSFMRILLRVPAVRYSPIFIGWLLLNAKFAKENEKVGKIWRWVLRAFALSVLVGTLMATYTVCTTPFMPGCPVPFWSNEKTNAVAPAALNPSPAQAAVPAPSQIQVKPETVRVYQPEPHPYIVPQGRVRPATEVHEAPGIVEMPVHEVAPEPPPQPKLTLNPGGYLGGVVQPASGCELVITFRTQLENTFDKQVTWHAEHARLVPHGNTAEIGFRSAGTYKIVAEIEGTNARDSAIMRIDGGC